MVILSGWLNSYSWHIAGVLSVEQSSPIIRWYGKVVFCIRTLPMAWAIYFS
jgi:hypothetical protein